MKICVIDDNSMYIKPFCNDIQSLTKEINISVPVYIYGFDNKLDFEQWFYKNPDVDICFLDVNLTNEEGNCDGFLLARQVKAVNANTLLIFLSTYDMYYKDMVQLEPFRFLPKPIDKNMLETVFIDAYHRWQSLHTDDYCILKYQYNKVWHQVNLAEIKYIYSEGRKVHMVSSTHDIDYMFYEKLDSLELRIKEITDIFIRISKSYLINRKFIESYGKNEVFVSNETFKISPKYKKRINFDI